LSTEIASVKTALMVHKINNKDIDNKSINNKDIDNKEIVNKSRDIKDKINDKVIDKDKIKDNKAVISLVIPSVFCMVEIGNKTKHQVVIGSTRESVLVHGNLLSIYYLFILFFLYCYSIY
jgi:hypothetical protein